jgi:hypothetical protein
VFGVACVAFLALTFSPHVQGDGAGYFAYLHSIVVDHDLNMTDEYAAARAAGTHVAGDTAVVPATGLPANQFSIGPAVLSLPFYLVALALKPSGSPQFEPPFTFAFTLASLLYGALALALIYVWLRRLGHTSGIALVAISGVALATPFLFYAVYDPSYSHMFSAFMVTAFMYVWWSRRATRGLAGWLALGVIGGLMALVRWQDAPLMAVTLLDVPRARWRLLAMAPGALVAFSPQLVADEVIFGHLTPGASTVSFSVLPGHYLDVLFSSFRGLFTWAPVLVAAVAGWWFVRDGALRAAFAMCFVITLAIIGAFVYWYGGAAFGMRFFINLTPFFAIGLAALASRLRPAVAWIAAGVVTAWNLLLILSFSHVMRPDQPRSYQALLADQVRAIAYLPHLVQGYVARALVGRTNLGNAAALLVCEIAVVLAALLVGRLAAPVHLPAIALPPATDTKSFAGK